MEFVDSHAHLYLEQFRNDLDEVIDRAREKGVKHIILPNIDSKTIASMHEVARVYPDICVPLAGLHPTHVKDTFKTELENVVAHLKTYDYKAIGEIGIDLYWDKSYFKEQQLAFEYQLNLAWDNHMPVVIHARNSFNEILSIIRKKEFNSITGIFHAFTGDLELALELIDRGFLLGIGGIITFKNSHLPEVVKHVELDHLVLETDSPYLAPMPYRGKRNESSYIYHIAEKVAEIKAVTLAEVAVKTTQNAMKTFKL